ncbi:uncharacterized protein F4807DRAFT_235674 [Annulohypoxylon truncatum]|uniref:uncharacterized protein n=1 Tax=Annulohypoxylon truncatum TaxID=327061 RepID=UPI002008132A|nr:uncharacterized protein F4807DRAFT_235674 [Annulohypoxylon truncatum]KAI1206304.1 hypothetical protein F4807DRAFT_235674 [Annulohypoxylon truncatum]
MRFSSLLLMVAAMCCAVHAGWLSWSAGGDGGLTAIPLETGNVSYAHDGWSPKPTAAPDAVQPEGDRVLEYLKRDTTTSNWTNAETCGWIADSESSSFGCGNGTCVTNANHIVACATGTFSPFYSMCLNYDAYKSGSCKNEDSSTGCCMHTDYPECVTYLWTDSPQRSMYRCWKSSVIITMLDEPEIVLDHPTRTPTSSSVPLMDGTSTEPNQQPGNIDGASIGKQIGAALGTMAIIFLFVLFIMWLHKRHHRRRLAEDRRRVREHLNSRLRHAQTVQVPTAADRATEFRTRQAYAAMLDGPRTPDQTFIHSRNRHGAIHLDHLNPTSSTAAMCGSEAELGPPGYDVQFQQHRHRAPGGTYASVSDSVPMSHRVETPPPTYQPSFLSNSTLGIGDMASRGTLRTGLAQGESQPNWIELSRSSPTLPAATRRATMWHPEPGNGGGGGIPASSTWQDVSGSVLSDEEREGQGEAERKSKELVRAVAEDDDESVFHSAVFGTVRREGLQKK